MTQPGQSIESITVPLGDPDALVDASRQLDGVSAQLESSAGQIFGLPGLMGQWAGPSSSAFAQLTGQHATNVRMAGVSVSLAAFGVRDAAHALRAAQEKARRAIARAEDARRRIDRANDDIADAQKAEGIATDRMFSALRARDAATTALANDLSGSGLAMGALQQADADYENAHRDLLAAQRAEARARDRLHQAQEDLKAARKQGADAAEDAQDAGLLLRGALAGMPAAVYGMPGMPGRSSLTDAAGIPRPQPVQVNNVPVGQREPPQSWPGWAKTLFKVGRGEYNTVDGTVHMVKSGVEHPDKIPGALKNLGEHPLDTAKGIVGYDDLANGRYADWFGSMGITFLAAGAGTGPARLSRMRRITGDPDLVRLSTRSAPANGAKFGGGKMDFTREDLERRPGTAAPKLTEEEREALAEKYPDGVQYTRAGYPIFDQYRLGKPVQPSGLIGRQSVDEGLANKAAGLSSTPPGYTWHHMADGKTMELIPSDLHEAARHTGGAAAIRNGHVGQVAAGGAFTPGERRGAIAGGAFGGTVFGPAQGGP